MQLKKIALSAAMAVLGCCTTLADTTVSVTTKGFMNGALNVYFQRKDQLNCSLEVQMRDTGAGDDAWATIASGVAVSGMQNITTGDQKVNWALFCYPTNFIGQADVRLRLTEGQTVGEWAVIEGLKAYWHARGTKQIGNTTAIGTVLDGNFRTMIDTAEANATPWFGFAYAPGTLVERIRIMPRNDSSNATRVNGATIDIASDETFTDA